MHKHGKVAYRIVCFWCPIWGSGSQSRDASPVFHRSADDDLT